MTQYYCTSYCNHGHSLSTGKPLDHECYVLPPDALAAEYTGNIEVALRLINEARPLRVHAGTRCRHSWERKIHYALSGHVVRLSTTCTECGLEKDDI